MRMGLYLAAVLAVIAPAEGLCEEPARSASSVHLVTPVSTESAVQHVRAVLQTLDNAIRSGNYSVLRDLAAPDYQSENSLEEIASAFAPLREAQPDFSFAYRIHPEFNSSTLIDSDGVMKLEGRFRAPTRDLHFAMALVELEGRWRMRRLDVSVRASQRSAYVKTVPPPAAHAPAMAAGSAAPVVPVIKNSSVVVRSEPMTKTIAPPPVERPVAATGSLRHIVAGPPSEPEQAAEARSETPPETPPATDQAPAPGRTSWGVKLAPSIETMAVK